MRPVVRTLCTVTVTAGVLATARADARHRCRKADRDGIGAGAEAVVLGVDAGGSKVERGRRDGAGECGGGREGMGRGGVRCILDTHHGGLCRGIGRSLCHLTVCVHLGAIKAEAQSSHQEQAERDDYENDRLPAFSRAAGGVVQNWTCQ